MFERLTTSARTVVRAGQEEAVRLRAAAVEAEHLLLALSAQAGSAAEALEQVGLDHARLLQLLDQERRRSLSFAGIDLDAFPAAVSVAGTKASRVPAPPGSVRLATSAKSVLERAVKDAARRGGRSMDQVDLLVAVLRAQSGTVPRVLALAGIDREALLAQLERRSAS